MFLFLAGLMIVVFSSSLSKWITSKFINESVDKLTVYLRMNGTFMMLFAVYIFYKLIPLLK